MSRNAKTAALIVVVLASVTAGILTGPDRISAGEEKVALISFAVFAVVVLAGLAVARWSRVKSGRKR